MSEEVWITRDRHSLTTVPSPAFQVIVATRRASRAPRDAALRPERYADPVGDYDRAPQADWQAGRSYGDGRLGRNPSARRRAAAVEAGLDVPEFQARGLERATLLKAAA